METKTVFPIVTGVRNCNEVEKSTNVGWSILFPGQTYYVVKLQMFPRDTYFMVKNDRVPMEYLLFAKRKTDGVSTRFQSVVGSARLDENLKTHLEVDFHLLAKTIFMRLQPLEGVRQ